MDESRSLLKDFLNFIVRNLFPLALLIGLLFLAVTGAPLVLEFKENYLEEAQRLIASLFIVAVFVERALEVFVVTWRGPHTNELDSEITFLSEQLAIETQKSGGAKTDELTRIENELKRKQRERITYKSDTQRMALWGGLLLGVLIGTAGLRVLSALLANLDKLTGLQAIVFRVTDVLLTGGLLAGGSDGIHKIYKVYSEFMDATAKRAKASNPVSDVSFQAAARQALTTPPAAPAPSQAPEPASTPSHPTIPIETPFGGSVG